jgi:hypothetical protein
MCVVRLDFLNGLDVSALKLLFNEADEFQLIDPRDEAKAAAFRHVEEKFRQLDRRIPKTDSGNRDSIVLDIQQEEVLLLVELISELHPILQHLDEFEARLGVSGERLHFIDQMIKQALGSMG